MKQKCGIASKEVIHATAELAKVVDTSYNSVNYRLVICRDRQLRKIFVSCVKTSRKQRSFLHILQSDVNIRDVNSEALSGSQKIFVLLGNNMLN